MKQSVKNVKKRDYNSIFIWTWLILGAIIRGVSSWTLDVSGHSYLKQNWTSKMAISIVIMGVVWFLLDRMFRRLNWR